MINWIFNTFGFVSYKRFSELREAAIELNEAYAEYRKQVDEAFSEFEIPENQKPILKIIQGGKK